MQLLYESEKTNPKHADKNYGWPCNGFSPLNFKGGDFLLEM